MKNSSSRGRSVGAITYKEIINSLYNANIIIINKDKTITLSPEIATLVLNIIKYVTEQKDCIVMQFCGWELTRIEEV